MCGDTLISDSKVPLFTEKGVNLLWTTLNVSVMTLFYLLRVLKDVRIALSMFFVKTTLSKGSFVFAGSIYDYSYAGSRGV